MSERPKTHQERAERATWMVNSLMDALSSDRLNAEAADIVARETYPTELVEAARRLAVFADAWDARPLRGVDDTMYTIHAGTEWEASIRLSDLRALRTVLSLYEDKP